MTAEEYISNKIGLNSEYKIHSVNFSFEQIKFMMQEFAKMHLRNAIEAQCKNVRIRIVKSQDGSPDIIEVDKDSILEAYPLDNIK